MQPRSQNVVLMIMGLISSGTIALTRLIAHATTTGKVPRHRSHNNLTPSFEHTKQRRPAPFTPKTCHPCHLPLNILVHPLKHPEKSIRPISPSHLTSLHPPTMRLESPNLKSQDPASPHSTIFTISKIGESRRPKCSSVCASLFTAQSVTDFSRRGR